MRNTSDQPLQTTIHLYANDSGADSEDFVNEDRIVSSVAMTVPAGSVAAHPGELLSAFRSELRAGCVATCAPRG